MNYNLEPTMNKKMRRTLCFFITLLLLFPATKMFGQQQEKKQGAYYTGKYRNLFAEAGYAQKDIDAKLEKAYHDLFEGPNRIYFEVEDSLAYVSDIKNNDARTEGLSYGLMVAVQFNKKGSI